ncbi:response regulator [candidate division KSB1 bacterium]|nr:response regulator [candidate division KSB1 bacterium]
MTNILVVEDDFNSLNGLVELFYQEGYGVFSARTARQAVVTLLNNPIDIVLSDYCLPDFDGVRLIKEIKQRKPFTQCFLVTAFATNEVVASAYQAGARRLLNKPLVIDELLDAVAEPLPSGYVARPRYNRAIAAL